MYLPEQVVIFFIDDKPALISHMASGNDEEWCEEVTISPGEIGNEDGTEPLKKGECGRSNTPGGVFEYYRRVEGVRESALGGMWNPVYFNYGIAIHGALNVPLQPASHGCIRIPLKLSEHFQELVADGDQVYVFDGVKEPEAYGAQLPTFNWRRPRLHDDDDHHHAHRRRPHPPPPATQPPTTRRATGGDDGRPATGRGDDDHRCRSLIPSRPLAAGPAMRLGTAAKVGARCLACGTPPADERGDGRMAERAIATVLAASADLSGDWSWTVWLLIPLVLVLAYVTARCVGPSGDPPRDAPGVARRQPLPRQHHLPEGRRMRPTARRTLAAVCCHCCSRSPCSAAACGQKSGVAGSDEAVATVPPRRAGGDATAGATQPAATAAPGHRAGRLDRARCDHRLGTGRRPRRGHHGAGAPSGRSSRATTTPPASPTPRS